MRPRLILTVIAMAASAAGAAWAQETEGRFEGTVKAFRASHVNAETIGTVAGIFVEEGQKVDEGEVLLKLDDSVESANYQLALKQSLDDSALKRAQANLAQADRILARQKGLFEGNALSKEDLEQAQYQRELAALDVNARERELERLKALAALREAELKRCTVRAPFTGVVAEKLIELGESTYPLDKRLFHLTDTSKVYVEVNPEISLLKTVAVGMPASVTTSLHPGKSLPGTVSFVSPSAITGGWSFSLKVLVDNPEGLLRPEMKADVTFSPADPAAAEGEGAGRRTGQ